MAGTIGQKYGMSGVVKSDSQDTLSIDYEYTHDSDVLHESQIVDVFNGAWAAGLPRKRQRLGATDLFAFDFSYKQNDQAKRMFTISVEYRRPEQLGAEARATADLHPIYQPVKNTISYIEKEIVIEKARNVEAITGGAARIANTLGYVQNGAGVVSQNPIIEVVRTPVLVSEKNISSLGGVLQWNRPYADGGYLLTTNNAAISIAGVSFPARTLKFAGVDVGDQQEFDGIPFWTATRMIEIHSTTDHIVDSVGTQYVDETGNMVPIYQYDADGNITDKEITEPIPIGLDGAAGTPGTSVQITYRYLDQISYNTLVT